MCMVTAVAEYPEDTKVRFVLSAGSEINDGPAVVVVDVTVSGAAAEGTCFQFRLKKCHVGIEKGF